MRLLIFKVNQLGDNLVFLPVVQCLEKALPDAEIALLTSPVAASIYRHCAPRVRVLEESTAEFNGAWKRPRKWPHLLHLVRAEKPDACLVANDQGNVAHLLARLSGAPVRVGPRESRCRLRPLLSHQTPLDLASPIAHQNWRIMQTLFDALGLDRSGLPDDAPAPDASAMTAASRAEKPFTLIHPGASRAYHRWSAQRYVELANRLADRIEVRFMLQGDPAEAGLDPRVRRESPGSLRSFFELMSQAALFIGSNSGPMHVASVCRIPSIIFAGPSAANWNPMWNLDRFTLLRDPALACQPCDQLLGPMNRCTNEAEPMACMNRVSVERALGRALEILGLK